jgi:hypothetical protein
MIKSVLMYGSHAFFNASPATIKKLELIQRRALTLALSIPRSTRVENTLALAGEPPLHFEFTKKLRRLAVKSYYNPSLFVADIFKESWFSYYDARARPRPFIIHSLEAIKLLLEQLTCCDNRVSALPPWSLKPPQTDVTVTTWGDKNENANVLKALADGMIEANSEYLSVFTDASKLADGQVGFGVIVKSPSASDFVISLRLNDNITIYKAELFRHLLFSPVCSLSILY